MAPNKTLTLSIMVDFTQFELNYRDCERIWNFQLSAEYTKMLHMVQLRLETSFPPKNSHFHLANTSVAWPRWLYRNPRGKHSARNEAKFCEKALWGRRVRCQGKCRHRTQSLWHRFSTKVLRKEVVRKLFSFPNYGLLKLEFVFNLHLQNLGSVHVPEIIPDIHGA